MNKPNAINPGASSTAEAIRHQHDGDTAAAATGEQAYENSAPGTVGNVPGQHKAVPGARVDVTMKANSKTEAEAGVPDTKPGDAPA
ncbi:hypothetical protein GN316_06995 [Xylophilus sp. Kf1]|nr:hypothetical protein [Xylophilus sp. Kf1]